MSVSAGINYTPPELARELVEEALRPHAIETLSARGILRLTVVDLACGDGALLQAAVDILAPELQAAYASEGELVGLAQATRLIQRFCIMGNDIDPVAVKAAKRRLPHGWFYRDDALFDVDVTARKGPLVFIGNPPFLGGGKISSVLGQEYRARLKERFPTYNGGADLCAFFFLVAADNIVREGVDGTISFIVTKTIAEGDTREAALGVLLKPSDMGVWTIWCAWRSRPWAGAAAVRVAIVHMMCEPMARRLGYGKAIDETYRQFKPKRVPQKRGTTARPMAQEVLFG